MSGLARFLFNNYADDATITPSSLRSGIAGLAVPTKTGSAIITTSGAYTGSSDRLYIVEIDSVSGGNEIGQATFKWSDDGGVTFTTGVTTAATPITLSNSVRVQWTAGAGNDFEVPDKWVFRAVNVNGTSRLVDRDPDTAYKSATLDNPNDIIFDLGSAQLINALAIQGHNLSASATITLEGNAADSWGSPTFSASVPFNASKILFYLASDQTFRYWRLVISDQNNTDEIIEIADIFLGDFLELSTTYAYNFEKTIRNVIDTKTTIRGAEKRRFYNEQTIFNAQLQVIPDADITLLETMFDAITDKTNGDIKPIWFNDDSEQVDQCWLMNWDQLNRTITFLNQNTVPINLREVVKSA